jgi:hypothetical protein
MPKNTPVHRMAKAMERRGVPVSEAIATAQKRTGMSYATGKRPKTKAAKGKKR